MNVDNAIRIARRSATRSLKCAASRVRAVLTSVCRSSCVLTSVCRSSWLRPCFGELKARRLARLGSTNSTVTASVACPFELVTRLVNSATNSARPASSRRRSAVRTASTSGADGGLANPSYADTNNRCPSASRRGSALRAAARSGGRLSSFSSGSVPQRLRWSQDRPVGQSNRDRRAGHAVDAAGRRRRGIEDDPQFELTVTGLTDQEQALRRDEWRKARRTLQRRQFDTRLSWRSWRRWACSPWPRRRSCSLRSKGTACSSDSAMAWPMTASWLRTRALLTDALSARCQARTVTPKETYPEGDEVERHRHPHDDPRQAESGYRQRGVVPRLVASRYRPRGVAGQGQGRRRNDQANLHAWQAMKATTK